MFAFCASCQAKRFLKEAREHKSKNTKDLFAASRRFDLELWLQFAGKRISTGVLMSHREKPRISADTALRLIVFFGVSAAYFMFFS